MRVLFVRALLDAFDEPAALADFGTAGVREELVRPLFAQDFDDLAYVVCGEDRATLPRPGGPRRRAPPTSSNCRWRTTPSSLSRT